LLIAADNKYCTRSDLDEILRRLQAAFPEMTVFVYLKSRLDKTSRKDIPGVLRQLQQEAETALSSIDRRVNRIWRRPRRIVTYSQSSVVAEIIKRHKDKVTSVLISCASPKNEGIAAARKLATAGLSVNLVTDAALPAMIEKGDYLFIGADAVTERCFINKCGTWPLLMATREKKAISFVLFESFKKVSSRSFSFHPRQHSSAEILTDRCPRIMVRNVYFEHIQLHWADWLISDQGAARTI
jgi:translation initiation factor 2B subunit (eIF-2B alpha/beta/delta family)